jgi:hypothetical protein
MFTMNFDEDLIDKFAEKIADRAYQKLKERLNNTNELPHLLTRSEAKEVLRCGDTKMSELFARPDFPVINEFGKKIPTHMLMKWIEQNTRWVEQNTNYYSKEVI